MNVFARFLWAASGLGVLIMLFGTYKDLNEEIALTPNGAAGVLLSRDTYFYAVVALLFLGNLLVIAVGRLLSVMPGAFFRVPHRAYWLQPGENRHEFNEILGSWLLGLAAVFNGFLMVVLKMVEANNHRSGHLPFTDGWLFLVGFALLALTLLALPLRLSVPKLHLLAERTR